MVECERNGMAHLVHRHAAAVTAHQSIALVRVLAASRAIDAVQSRKRKVSHRIVRVDLSCRSDDGCGVTRLAVPCNTASIPTLDQMCWHDCGVVDLHLHVVNAMLDSCAVASVMRSPFRHMQLSNTGSA
jgi:hypothetical protein